MSDAICKTPACATGKKLFALGLCRHCWNQDADRRRQESEEGALHRGGPPPLLRCSRCNLKYKASATARGNAAKGKPTYCSRDCQKAANLVEIPCVTCGEPLTRRKSSVAPSGRAFCDGVCRGRASKPKTGRHVPCEQGCGNDVWVKKSEDGRKRFCSKECSDLFQGRNKVTRDCDQCGDSYTRSASSVGRFCSQECGHAARVKGEPWLASDGYLVMYVGDYKVRKVHQVNAEKSLGRALLPNEDVHHVSSDKLDNHTDGPFVLTPEGKLRSGNLEIWAHSHPRGAEIGPRMVWFADELVRYASVLPKEIVEQLAGIVERHRS